MNGIACALLQLSRDEGPAHSRRVAEQWLLALEAMAEVANEEQRAAISRLMAAISVSLS